MKRLLKRIFSFSKSTTDVRYYISPLAQMDVSSKAIVEQSDIRLENGSKLVVADGAIIKNFNIHIIEGVCEIGPDTRLIGNSSKGGSTIYIEKGNLIIADHCVIKSDFSIRFGGMCSVGSYTGIMDNTEIRCDDQIQIGSFNMISYECMIYDTNTHCQYPIDVRRRMTELSFPNIGAEKEKPITSPVKIGDDCWIGKRGVILKGVTVGNNSTIAACSVLTKSCPEGSMAYGNPAVIKIK